MDCLEMFLKKIGTGLKPIDDPFFNDSHKVCNIVRRMGITVEEEEELCHNVMNKFRCNIVGCVEEFQTLLDFEIHYNGSHRYACQSCKKILPTPRILDIHIQETHDTFFQVMAQKQPAYQCYSSECDMKFMNIEDRRSHCISVHIFPKRFRYDEPFRHKSKSPENMETDQPEKDCPTNKGKKTACGNTQKRQKAFAKFKDSDNYQSTNTNESTIIQSNPNPVSDRSPLMFLPRQVQQKSFAKSFTKSERNTESNVLESDSIIEMADMLPDISK